MPTTSSGSLGLRATHELELEMLREVLARVPVGVVVYEPVDGGRDFRFAYLNDALQKTKSFRDMVGRTVREAWPDHAEEGLNWLRQVLDTGMPLSDRSLSLEVEIAPGQRAARQFAQEIVRASVGGQPILVGFMTDVTHQRQMTRALEQVHREAKLELEISETLRASAIALAAVGSVREAAASVAELLLEALGHARVTVVATHMSQEYSVILASRGEQALPEDMRLPFVSVSTPLEEALVRGELVVFDFESVPPESRGPAGLSGSSIVLLAPMTQASQMLGMIAVDDPGGRRSFSERDKRLAQGIASQAAVAIQNARTLQTQRERSERWRMLAALAELSSSALDVTQIIEHALQLAETHLGARASSVWTLDETAERLMLVSARGFPAEFLHDFPAGVEIAADFPISRAARQAEPVIFSTVDDDTLLNERVRQAYQRYGMGLRALAALPLIAHGSVIGTMTLAWEEQRTFDDAHRLFLTTLAERFAASLYNARLFSERALQTRYAEALNRINEALHATLSASQVLQRIAEEMSAALDVDESLVQLRREGYREIGYGRGLPDGIDLSRLPPERTPLSILMERTLAPVVVADITTDQRAEGTVLRQLGLRSVIGVPLFVRSEVVGALFLGRQTRNPFSEREVEFAARVAATASLAMENASLYETQQRLADRLQEALLSLPEEVEGLEFAHEYRSAAVAARVGGDFYDVFSVDDNHVGIVIGDVAGKGLEAAVLTSVVRGTIRAHVAEHVSHVASIMALTNDVLYKATPPGSFVTVFLGILDCDEGILTYANAGHTTPFIHRGDGTFTALKPTGVVLGAFPHVMPAQATAPFLPGELLFLYTDGVIEARRGDEMYGEERLRDILASVPNEPPGTSIRAVTHDVLDFTGGELADDVAMLAVRRRRQDTSQPS